MPTKAVLHLYLCFFILSGCTRPNYEVVNSGHEGERIPSFDFISADSNRHLNTQNVPPGSPVVMFYFQPNCPFCQSQIAEITQHISTLVGTRFFLVTAHSSKDLKALYKTIQIQHLSNFFVAIDYKNEFQDYFNPEGVPYTAVYRSDQTLSKAYLGALTGKEITNALNN